MSALLEVREVSVRFGGLQALDDVSLSAKRGSIVGLIGPNGAGKTTLFNVISGLGSATRGRVTFDGADLDGVGPSDRARRGIGRSFQNLGLMVDETVRTNLLAAQHLSSDYRLWEPLLRPRRWRAAERRLGRRARHALARFGLEEHLDTIVSDLPFATARFVEIAAVLAEEPTLMLLDEPTTGLDLNETARLLDILREVRASGTTIFVVAHHVRFITELCNYVYVLAEGRLLTEGPPSEVQRSPAVIDAYLGGAR